MADTASSASSQTEKKADPWFSKDDAQAAIGLLGPLTAGVGQIFSAWAGYGAAKLNASLTEAQSLATAGSAVGYIRQAREARRMAGLAQITGRDQAENRSRALGQQLGKVYSGAAASGIDTASRTVRDVDRAVRLAASRDISAISHNARENSAAYLSRATQAEGAWYAAQAQALMQKAQARYQRRMAKVNRNVGYWNGIGQLVGVAAGAAAGGIMGATGAIAGTGTMGGIGIGAQAGSIGSSIF